MSMVSSLRKRRNSSTLSMELHFFVLPWWRHQWKYFQRYWPCVRGIHRSPVNSPHKDQWRGALMLSLICARINAWENNRKAGDLRRHRAHYDVIVMRDRYVMSHYDKPRYQDIPPYSYSVLSDFIVYCLICISTKCHMIRNQEAFNNPSFCEYFWLSI